MKNYQDRDVLDKLGVKPGHAVAFDARKLAIDSELRQRIIERTGQPAATEQEALDLIFVTIDETEDPISLLRKWRAHLVPNGAIWLLTAKRGLPGYVDQNELIAAGQQADMVDNKVCSVSPTTSAIRFVIRKRDRAKA